MDKRNNLKFRSIAAKEISKFKNHKAVLYDQIVNNSYNFSTLGKYLIVQVFTEMDEFLNNLENYLIECGRLDKTNIEEILESLEENIEIIGMNDYNDDLNENLEIIDNFNSLKKNYLEYVKTKIKRNTGVDVAVFFVSTTEILMQYMFTTLTVMQELNSIIHGGEIFISLTTIDVDYVKLRNESIIDKKIKIFKSIKKINESNDIGEILIKNYLHTDSVPAILETISSLNEANIKNVI